MSPYNKHNSVYTALSVFDLASAGRSLVIGRPPLRIPTECLQIQKPQKQKAMGRTGHQCHMDRVIYTCLCLRNTQTCHRTVKSARGTG